jgi:hypothetical protein
MRQYSAGKTRRIPLNFKHMMHASQDSLQLLYHAPEYQKVHRRQIPPTCCTVESSCRQAGGAWKFDSSSVLDARHGMVLLIASRWNRKQIIFRLAHWRISSSCPTAPLMLLMLVLPLMRLGSSPVSPPKSRAGAYEVFQPLLRAQL